MRHIILLVLLLALSISARGQLYKWVDKDGQTQYTGQPPPPGAAKEEKKLNIKSAPAQPVASKATNEGKAGAPKTLAEKELEFKKRRIAEGEVETKRLAEAKQNQEKCAQAKTNLKTYQDTPRLTLPDGAGGTTYADDAARQKGIDEAQKEIASFCK